ncbi:MAG TPA: UDP-N-acetylmuramate--L-alanine ligase [Allosphingosinicella sp.]|nr:UDP-N-acetylmuramate--L-alanine ligase [Allosphingosinicella sp.]
MRGVGQDIGTIHFVGIGGIGMSGIAEVMHILGYKVQGSDMAEGYVVEGLRKLGIPVAPGHSPDNLGDAAVVVISTAIGKDNSEVVAAYERRIPVVRRAEMLAELMRLKLTVAVAGTHGKTTTTSMIAALLDAGGIDPTVINGGIINAYGSNARLGKSEWMVVEADESDGSFLRLDGTIAVVTNIDPEHLDFYGGFEAVKDAFVAFIENVPFYGAALLCVDHPEVQSIIPRLRDRRVVTYGFAAQADIRGENVVPVPGGSRFDVSLRGRGGEVRTITGIQLPMPGRHNVQNALAAIGVAAEMGIADEVIAHGFDKFHGVKRRFTKVGEVDGVTIIDDYGHHPVEIAAVLSAAREGAQGRVIALVQPHRYTRLHDLMAEFQGAFNDADLVLVAPVYAAGEAPIEGASHEALVDGLKQRGHLGAHVAADADDVCRQLAGLAAPGDMIICLGAGDITKWAAGLADGIRAARAVK